MKRQVSFLLLLLYLCISTEGYQLLKIPALINHFITHCQKEPGTTLIGFLQEHYSSETVYDDDWQQDMELPFKCCECVHHAVPVTLRAESVVLPEPQPVESRNIFNPIQGIMYSNGKASKIFQPPRPVA